MTMNKKEILTKMIEFTGSTKIEAEKNLDAFLKTIEYAVENKEKLNVIGYFSIGTITKAPRVCRNPKTGEEIQVPEKDALKFKTGKILADLVNR